MSKKIGRVYLFELLLFLLVILGELPKIYVLYDLEILVHITNFIQFPLYVGLMYQVIRQQCSLKQFVLFSVIGILLLIGYIVSSQAAYVRGLMLILAVEDIPFKRMLHVCRVAMTSMFCVTVILWMLRLSDSGIGIKGKPAFGYIHSNIAAQVAMIIFLLWLTEKGEKVGRREYIIIEIAAILLFVFTGSKTATSIMAAAPILSEICKKAFQCDKRKSLVFWGIEIAQAMILLFTWWSARLLANVSFLKRLDLMVTNRLFLNYYLFDKYSLKLFGQNVTLQESTSVYNNIQDVWGAVITCDNTYVMSLLIMGILPTIIFLLGYVFLVRKAIRQRDRSVVVAAMLLALYAFCESQLVEIYNNFVYLYILAAPTVCRQERMKIYDS